jgi:hypothetical protein
VAPEEGERKAEETKRPGYSTAERFPCLTVRHYAIMDNAIHTLGAFILPLVTNVIVLVYSFVGYKRTKRAVFTVWIVACTLSLIGVFALYGLRDAKSSIEHHGLWLFWAFDSMVVGIIGTFGVILLMRDILSSKIAKPDA